MERKLFYYVISLLKNRHEMKSYGLPTTAPSCVLTGRHSPERVGVVQPHRGQARHSAVRPRTPHTHPPIGNFPPSPTGCTRHAAYLQNSDPTSINISAPSAPETIKYYQENQSVLNDFPLVLKYFVKTFRENFC